MKRLTATTLLLALSACATTATDERHQSPLSIDPVGQALQRYGFEGEVAYVRDADELNVISSADNADTIWPWASVSKQVTAVIVMQLVDDGMLDLDRPVDAYLDDWPQSPLPAPSLRQLLRHQSGLADPEDRSDFRMEDLADFVEPYGCVPGRKAPGGEFAYKNCDTRLVAKVLERVTGTPFGTLLRQRVLIPAGMKRTGMASASTPIAASEDGVSARIISYFGAAGAMVGPAYDLLQFDKALLSGRLLSDEARAEMWRGDPSLGYTALGQWEFTAALEGCDAPVRIVERRGAIRGYQVRNFILPERDFVMVAFTARSEADYPFGEIWTGEGLSHDLLSAAAC